MKNSEIFWVSMDGQTLGITLGMAALCMGLPIYFHSLFEHATALTTAATIAPIILFLGVALFAVKSYHLDDGDLCIKRTLWTTRIRLLPFESAEIVPNAMDHSRRVCGIGGTFGWIGWFRSEKLGGYRAWVTDRSRTVVLKGGGKTYVVSPLKPEKFVRAVQAIKA